MQRRQHGAERISLRGSYPLAFVLGVPMPATVKDPPTQMWIQYSSGALLLRGDGTFDLNVDGRFPDYDIPVNAHTPGRFSRRKRRARSHSGRV